MTIIIIISNCESEQFCTVFCRQFNGDGCFAMTRRMMEHIGSLEDVQLLLNQSKCKAVKWMLTASIFKKKIHLNSILSVDVILYASPFQNQRFTAQWLLFEAHLLAEAVPARSPLRTVKHFLTNWAVKMNTHSFRIQEVSKNNTSRLKYNGYHALHQTNWAISTRACVKSGTTKHHKGPQRKLTRNLKGSSEGLAFRLEDIFN